MARSKSVVTKQAAIDQAAAAKHYSEVSAVVTLGEESAARLRAMGHDVKAGDQIDLGVVAVHHPSKFKNFFAQLRQRRKKHLLSKPLPPVPTKGGK